MELPAVIEVAGLDLLIWALLVLWFGEFVTRRIRFLTEYSIPSVVVGGLCCSAVIAGVEGFGGPTISFGLDVQAALLLAFFSTVGLSVEFSTVGRNLRALLVLLALSTALLIFQDMAGSAIAAAFGGHPAYGLLAGSIAFVGGHGTGIAWGEIFASRFDIEDAQQTALACATFGLVLGGLIGGPLARRLIEKHGLEGDRTEDAYTPSADDPTRHGPASIYAMLNAILLVALCMGAARAIGPWFARFGLTVPEFIIALFAGAVLIHLASRVSIKVSVSGIGLISDVTLQIFLAISISSIQLLLLKEVFGPLLSVLVLQIALVVLFAYFIVFPALGRDYDASVICAGFAGFGLGATPVGLANMRAITRNFGASPRAFLVVPLVGAFLIDIVNSFVIQLYLVSPALK